VITGAGGNEGRYVVTDRATFKRYGICKLAIAGYILVTTGF